MIANAWGDFKNPTPNLLFVVVQIAAALVLIAFAFTGKNWSANQNATNRAIRLLGAAVLFYAASYFYAVNDSLRSLLQVFGASGLLLLFFTERKIFNPCTILINEKGVHTPGNIKERLIEWKDIDNMVVRNDFVSINTVQNHFIQYETAAVLSELQMDEMNAYCRSKFTKS